MENINELKEEIKRLKKEIAVLKTQTYLDNTTQCYNRAWFYENILNNKEYYITIADINFLRTINFVMGHSVGDELINECVTIFKKYGDVIRTGGDEFIIISYNKKDFDALNKINNNKFALGGCHKTAKMPIAHAIKIADQNLYESKKYHKTGGAYEE